MDPENSTSSGKGRLRIVATPIGNLEDLSPRARRAFEEADRIACEDTRHTGRLLAEFGIKKPLISLHEHNERHRVPNLIEKLEQGENLAVASDAGTPLLSDPGFLLVREAAAHGIPVEAIPGPSAILTALVVSALPPYPFTFVGFPPPKTGKRRTFFERLAELPHTLIFFESPHRLLASLGDARAVFGDRKAAVARELTKMYEEVLRGSLSELETEIGARPALKGEMVVVVEGAPTRRKKHRVEQA